MYVIRIITITLLAAVAAVAAPQAVDPGTIKDKVIIAVRQESTIEFQRMGDRLSKPTKAKQADASSSMVRIKLDLTSSSPFPPPREGAMRPFLHVENGFEKTLHYRALARLKGSKEFFEITEGLEPIAAGKSSNKCWDFDSQIEEVVLYQFALSNDQVD